MKLRSPLTALLLTLTVLLPVFPAARADDAAPPTPSAADKSFTDADVRQCVDAGNVFVIVDPIKSEALGGCATKFGTGHEALVSAGFTTDSDSFIKEIDGIRADYNDGSWWTYFHRHFDSNSGTWGEWEFSNQGVGLYEPSAGSVEGWAISSSDLWNGNPPRWAGYTDAPKIPDDSKFAALMPDANYRKCVTDKLGLSVGSVPTTKQLGSITELSCVGREIEDLTGTDALTGITKLFVGNNAITSLEPIESSTNIFSISFQNNQITDISALAKLTKLRSVTMNNNKISDISVLGKLPEWDRGSGGARQAQAIEGSPQQAGIAVAPPTLIGYDGHLVAPEPPEGLAVADGKVTYPNEGVYTWRFRDEQDFGFNGTVTVQVTTASEITVPDDAFRTCINEALKIDASQQPRAKQLSGLTGELNCMNRGIKSLEGAQHLTSVAGFKLFGNQISDLSPLAGLKKLTYLDVGDNSITSIAPLGKLPELQTLNALALRESETSKSQLTSLQGIENFPKLTSITLNNQPVGSLDALSGNKALKSVAATNAGLADVAFAAELPALNTLWLDANHIGDLSPLEGLTFSRLDVREQTLTAPDATAGVPTKAPSVTDQDASTLVAFSLNDVEVKDAMVIYANGGTYKWVFTNAEPPARATFSGTIQQKVAHRVPPVIDADIKDPNFRACLNGLLQQDAKAKISKEQLAGLTEVSCVDEDIEDISGAEHLVAVTELILSINKISDLAPIAGLTKLDTLLVPTNEITDLSPLKGLTALTLLNASYNPLTSLAGIEPLTELRLLSIGQKANGHSGITSLVGVEGLAKLESIVFNNSQVSDLAPLSRLAELKSVQFIGNNIGDLGPLAGLAKLEKVGADENVITDISPLARLPKLQRLSVNSNKITDVSSFNSKDAAFELRARWQVSAASKVPAGKAIEMPKITPFADGEFVLTPPEGVSIENAMVTYPSEGEYVWTWSAKRADEYFAGTLTQPVGLADDPSNNPASNPRDDSTSMPTVTPAKPGAPKPALPKTGSSAESGALGAIAVIVSLAGGLYIRVSLNRS